VHKINFIVDCDGHGWASETSGLLLFVGLTHVII